MDKPKHKGPGDGKSFVRQHIHNGAVIEVGRIDELSPLDQEAIKQRNREKMAAVRAHQEAGGKKRGFLKGNKLGGKRPKLAKLGVKNVDAASPEYQATLKKAESYRRYRVREYTKNFGHVSTGVRGLLATAALQIAASRYMMDQAMELGDMDMLKKASGMANDARQNELAAWELCSREAVVHKKNQEAEVPWQIRVADDDGKKSHEALDGSDSDADGLSHTGAAEAPIKRTLTND